MNVIPISLADANAFVTDHHRHHKKVIGHKFSIGAEKDGKLVAVAIVSRPVARMLQDGLTCEITRLCSDGTKNACSFLYARSWRIAQMMGYKRMVTYTLADESGASLRAAGWKLIGEAGGGSWSRPSRLREDKHPLQLKLRWEVS